MVVTEPVRSVVVSVHVVSVDQVVVSLSVQVDDVSVV
jgi:hypothetical protein